MDKPINIYEDQRPIKGIYFDDGREGWGVGKVISRIVPYQENGEMALVTWLAVYQGENIIARIPAKLVQILYK